MSTRAGPCALLVAAVLTAAYPATAAGPPLLVEQEANDRFKKGMEYAAQGHGERAWMMFTEAYSVAPTLKTLFNLAVLDVETKRYVDALRHFRAFLADPSARDADKATARRLMDEAYANTGHVRVERVLGASLSFAGSDKKSVDHAREVEELDVQVGRHTLVARKGDVEERREVEAPAGKSVTLRFTKFEATSPAPSAPSTNVPPTPTTLPAASAPSADVPPAPASTARTMTLVFGGTALAALGIGAGFALAANGKRDEADRLSGQLPRGACDGVPDPRCAELDAARDAHGARAQIANGFFIVGGVALLATGVSAYLWLKEPRGQQTAVVPLVGPQGAGIQLRTSF